MNLITWYNMSKEVPGNYYHHAIEYEGKTYYRASPGGMTQEICGVLHRAIDDHVVKDQLLMAIWIDFGYLTWKDKGDTWEFTFTPPQWFANALGVDWQLEVGLVTHEELKHQADVFAEALKSLFPAMKK